MLRLTRAAVPSLAGPGPVLGPPTLVSTLPPRTFHVVMTGRGAAGLLVAFPASRPAAFALLPPRPAVRPQPRNECHRPAAAVRRRAVGAYLQLSSRAPDTMAASVLCCLSGEKSALGSSAVGCTRSTDSDAMHSCCGCVSTCVCSQAAICLLDAGGLDQRFCSDIWSVARFTGL